MASFVTDPLVGLDDQALEVERNIVLNERFADDPRAGGAVGNAVMAAIFPAGFPGSRRPRSSTRLTDSFPVHPERSRGTLELGVNGAHRGDHLQVITAMHA